MESDRQKCFDIGMNDYLAKPIKFESLQELLSRILTTPRELRNGDSSFIE